MHLLQSMPYWLSSLLIKSPLILIWIAGTIWVIFRRKDRPKTSRFAITGLLILIFEKLGYHGFYAWIPGYTESQNLNYDQTNTVYALADIGFTLIETIGWIWILLALFTRQRKM